MAIFGTVAVLAALCIPGLALSAQSQATDVLQRLEQLPEDELIVFEPDEARHTVIVFTDVNCPYCRTFHQQIDDYLLFDIRIRYAAYPNIGNAREQMQAVWCSEDRKDALTRAKRGEKIDAPRCPNPVDRHYELARELGLRGTPAIITPRGRVLYGRIPADDLAQVLEDDE